MYRRSSLGLGVLMSVASCVPPQSLASAPQTPSAVPETAPPRVTVAPGIILAAMPIAPPPAIDGPLVLQAAPSFVDAAQSSSDAARALDCLTAAVYYEARSESEDGQRAVAQVVLNRVRNPAFPASVCGVVYQGSFRATGCQFSFTCDGSLLRPREPGAWAEARAIATEALAGQVYAPIGSAMYYHTTAVHPWWAPSLTPVTTIGAHIFYRWGNGLDNGFEYRQRYAGIEPQGAGAAGWDQAQQVLIRYGNSESAGVMIHRGGGQFAAGTVAGVTVTSGVPADARAAAQPASATPATVADASQSFASDGVNVSSVHVHFGKPRDASADGAPAAETAKADPSAADPTASATTPPAAMSAAQD